MNHVLHLMLMGLGREGSISIAYLILLSGRDRIPLGCAFGWRLGRVTKGRAGASMPERCTVCTMASLPFPFPIPAHDTLSEWSWIFSQTSEETETRESPVLHLRPLRAGRILTPLVVSGLSYTPYRYRTTGMCSARRGCAPHADQTPRGGRRPLSARPNSANSALSVPLSPAFSSTSVDVSDPTPNSIGAQSGSEPAASATHSQLFLHFVTASGLPSSRSPWIVESV